jgi:hypothetical protein
MIAYYVMDDRLARFIRCGESATTSATVGNAVRVPWSSPTAWAQGCGEGRALRIRPRNLQMPTLNRFEPKGGGSGLCIVTEVVTKAACASETAGLT